MFSSVTGAGSRTVRQDSLLFQPEGSLSNPPPLDSLLCGIPGLNH